VVSSVFYVVCSYCSLALTSEAFARFGFTAAHPLGPHSSRAPRGPPHTPLCPTAWLMLPGCPSLPPGTRGAHETLLPFHGPVTLLWPCAVLWCAADEPL